MEPCVFYLARKVISPLLRDSRQLPLLNALVSTRGGKQVQLISSLHACWFSMQSVRIYRVLHIGSDHSELQAHYGPLSCSDEQDTICQYSYNEVNHCLGKYYHNTPHPWLSSFSWLCNCLMFLFRHNDIPWQLRKNYMNQMENVTLDKSNPAFHTDIPRLREGKVGAQVSGLGSIKCALLTWTPGRFSFQVWVGELKGKTPWGRGWRLVTSGICWALRTMYI